MTAEGEQGIGTNPHEGEVSTQVLVKLAGGLAQLPVLQKFSPLWRGMLDDLAANGVVETVFATATTSRLLMLGAVVFIVSAIAFVFRHRDDLEEGAEEEQNRLPTWLAFLTFAYGIPLWLVMPYQSAITAWWLKASVILLFAIGMALIALPASRPAHTVPLVSLLVLLSLVAVIALGAIPGAPSGACSACEHGQVRAIYRTHPTKLHPTATPSPTPTRESTPVLPTVLPPPVVVTVVVVVEQAPNLTAGPTELPEQAPDSTPEPTPDPTAGCPDLDYPVLRPPGAMHLVQKDENLATLAEQYGTTVQALVQANSPYYATLEERPDCIRDGWWLIVPSR